jgi:hypothetical protein
MVYMEIQKGTIGDIIMIKTKDTRNTDIINDATIEKNWMRILDDINTFETLLLNIKLAFNYSIYF